MSFLCINNNSSHSQVSKLKTISYISILWISDCEQALHSCLIITKVVSRCCSGWVLPGVCEEEILIKLILLRTVWFLVIVGLTFPYLYWLSVRTTISNRTTIFFATWHLHLHTINNSPHSPLASDFLILTSSPKLTGIIGLNHINLYVPVLR